MATSLSKGLEELVMCPICCEQFQDPRVLPCLHTYCKRCLERLLAGKTTISCPECRKTVQIQDVNELKVNFQINNLTSLLEDKKGKTVITQKPSLCQKHKEALKLFCETCEQLICCECIVVDHNGHQFGYLEEIAKTRKEHLTERIKACIADMDEAKTELDEMLMPDKVTLKQDIIGVMKKKDEDDFNDLIMHLTNVESVIEFTKQKLTRCSDIEIVLFYTQVMTQLDEMQTISETKVGEWEESATTEKSREPIDLEVLSAHEKSSADHPRPTSMVQEWEVERNGERASRSCSFPAANVATLKQLQRIGPELQSPHENMMKELHTVIKDSGSINPGKRRAPLPPPTMSKGKGLVRKQDNVRPSSTSSVDVAMQKQGVDSKVLNSQENMINEFLTVSKDSMKSPQKPSRPQPPIPMAKGKGLERRMEDVRPSSTSSVDVAMQRQGVDSKMNEMMLKELHTAISTSGSRNPTGDQPPTSPMTGGKEEEKREADEKSSSSISATDVATLRQRFEQNVNLK